MLEIGELQLDTHVIARQYYATNGQVENQSESRIFYRNEYPFPESDISDIMRAVRLQSREINRAALTKYKKSSVWS